MIRGVVVRGNNLGKALGYPTANVDIHIQKIKLHEGVYAAQASLHGIKYQAALIINRSRKKIEIHFIDYTGEDFYGEEVVVEPIQQISRLEKYDSVDELRLKIQKDIDIIKTVFIELSQTSNQSK